MGESGRNSLEAEIKGVMVKGRGSKSRFFHRTTNSHFKKHAILRIKINGVWMTEEQDIRQGVANVFQFHLLESSDCRAGIDGLTFASLTEEEANSLEMPFREKIYIALKELNGDKAPGLDSFIVSF